MSTLFVINQSFKYEFAQQLRQAEDAILLIENAVSCVLDDTKLDFDYALTDDVFARGVPCPTDKLIDMPQFVHLCTQFDKVVSL